MMASGDGYVHRLILLKSDPDEDLVNTNTASINGAYTDNDAAQSSIGSRHFRALLLNSNESNLDSQMDSESIEQRPRLKVVETIDPRYVLPLVRRGWLV